MRAEKDARHLSGAERIVAGADIETAVCRLIRRATEHPNGTADSVTIKILPLSREILFLPPLPVTEAQAENPGGARALLAAELEDLGLPGEKILALFYALEPMRGAALLDVQTLRRLEPDPARGIRVTNMDYVGNAAGSGKDHFREALCLASKVAHGPGIVGELCISDDADYTTGYFASAARGYIRIPHIKEKGDTRGGRLFLLAGGAEKTADCIDYIENQPVIVGKGGR
jgi:6-carboxyhexanoate--CoA ligase